MKTTEHIKVVPFKFNEKKYNCPAIDLEDVFFNNFKTKVFTGRRNKTFKDLLKRQWPKVKDTFVFLICSRIIRIYFDKVLSDVILENAVFLLPYKVGYIVAAQKARKNERYNYKTQQNKVRLFFIFSRRSYRYSKGSKLISVSKKYSRMLAGELRKGHIYPRIDDIIEKMKDYGY